MKSVDSQKKSGQMILESVNHLKRFLLLVVDISFLGSLTIIIHCWLGSDCFRRLSHLNFIQMTSQIENIQTVRTEETTVTRLGSHFNDPKMEEMVTRSSHRQRIA